MIKLTSLGRRLGGRRKVQFVFAGAAVAAVVVGACSASDLASGAGPTPYSPTFGSFVEMEETSPDVSVEAAGGAGGAGGASAITYDVWAPSNPFEVVRHDPLSTFAADVDTASYDYFRAREGDSPTDTVRLEEFVNFFDYDYAAPAKDAAHPFEIHLDAAPGYLERGTTVLRVGLQGYRASKAEVGPVNLVFLVDTSGSMSSYLSSVKTILRETVELLDPGDTISVVRYAGSSGTVLKSTPVEKKDTILSAVNKLESGGGTNGASGINEAYAQAKTGFIEGGINHVLLCTDGDFNVGPTSTEALEDLIVEKRKTGVTLTVLGFGGGYNDEMNERLSNAGNGIAAFIASDAEAQRYAEKRMLQSLIHVAKDVKIQVEFNQEHVHAYRLLGYENRALEDWEFRDDVVDAGEVGSGHSVTALYELVLADGQLPEVSGARPLKNGDAYQGDVEIDPSDLVLVKLRYKQPGASVSDSATELSASLAADAVGSSFDAAPDSFKWALAVANFAERAKASPYADPSHDGPTLEVLSAQELTSDEYGEFVNLVRGWSGPNTNSYDDYYY